MSRPIEKAICSDAGVDGSERRPKSLARWLRTRATEPGVPASVTPSAMLVEQTGGAAGHIMQWASIRSVPRKRRVRASMRPVGSAWIGALRAQLESDR